MLFSSLLNIQGVGIFIKNSLKNMRRIVLQDYKNCKPKQKHMIENYVTNHTNEYGLCQLKKQQQQALIDVENRKISFLKANKDRILQKTTSCPNVLNTIKGLSNKKLNKQFVLPLSAKQMKQQILYKFKKGQKQKDGISVYSSLNILNFPTDREKADSILDPSTSQYQTEISNQVKKNKYRQLQFKIKTPRAEKRTIDINAYKNSEQVIKKHHNQKRFKDDDITKTKKFSIKGQDTPCQQCMKKSIQITELKEMLQRVGRQLKQIKQQSKNIEEQVITLKNQYIKNFELLTCELYVNQSMRSATCPKIQQSKQNKSMRDESQSSVIKIKIDQFIDQLSLDISRIIDHKFITENGNGRKIGKIVKIKNTGTLDGQLCSIAPKQNHKEEAGQKQSYSWPQDDNQQIIQRISGKKHDQG